MGATPQFAWAFAAVALAATLFACSDRDDADGAFEALAREYLEETLRLSPEFATYLGDHRFDDRLSDYSEAGFEAALEHEKRFLARLGAIPAADLNPDSAIDFEILRNRVEAAIFDLEEIREYRWNPLVYNPGGAIYSLLARDFGPLEARLRNVGKRLEAIPGVLEAAKANLRNPPEVHAETALIQFRGTIGLIADDLEPFLDQAPAAREQLQPARERALAALGDFSTWLEADLLPRSNGDFRLGEEKFRRKLALTLHSDLSMEEIRRRALEQLAETQARLYETALPLHREFFSAADEAIRADRKRVIRETLDRLAEDRPTNETIVDDAGRALEETTAFVRDRGLVSLPDEPLEIIVMPEFQRGVSTAYCDSPGPLEKNAKTFYAIAPAPAAWSAEREESLYREYNDYMLRDLTVHEAMPGHYLQLAHSNRFQGSTPIRAAFSSGVFVEGWAVYAERLMVEHGYGGPEVAMQQLKMLTRAILNALLDQDIHAGRMTEQEALDLMMKDGFQEEGEAAGKWNRARLTSTQLSTYFVGASEIDDIRRAWEAKHGEITDWRAFHDGLLAFGSPPPKFVRRLLGLD